MTKLLVIPDVHGRTFWKQATQEHKDNVDRIIFIGDYLDSYDYEGISQRDTVDNFKEIITFKKENEDKTILLLGNHDLPYFIKEFDYRIRFDYENQKDIGALFKENIQYFKLAHEEDVNGKKYLFTHAGLMNSWVERNKEIIGEPTVDNLNKLLGLTRGIAALSELSSYRSWIGEKSGSVVWSDVREKIDDKSSADNIIPNEDSIVEMYDYQIFGHTQLEKEPIITDKWACIDCRCAFLLDTDGTLTKS